MPPAPTRKREERKLPDETHRASTWIGAAPSGWVAGHVEQSPHGGATIGAASRPRRALRRGKRPAPHGERDQRREFEQEANARLIGCEPMADLTVRGRIATSW